MRIIKRTKLRNTYYYLQHSFRKGKKIITKEKYLGKNIPKNIEIIKLQMQEAYKKELTKKLEIIKRNFQKEWKRYPKSIQQKEKEEIALAFTYNTNAIEGSTITLEETREIVMENIAPNKSLRDIKETESHYKLFLKILDKEEKISIELILEWHKLISQDTKADISGKFRDYIVSVANYRAPDWQDIDFLMHNFIDFLGKSKMNPAELAARAHYKFEKIHPFGDGNGRLGRMIYNHILWHNKYPMLIIEYQKRRSYYKALQRDEDGFVKYFIRRYLSVHKKRL